MMQYDLLVLGSGPGGYVAAIRAAQLGMTVAVVEKESLGGVCLNWGCIPTKALLKSAKVYENIQHAASYGLIAEKPSYNLSEIVGRSREVAEKMSKGVQFLLKKNKIEVLPGTGKLLPDNKVSVTDKHGDEYVVAAKNIIIATGARSKNIAVLPQDGKKIIGYKEAMIPLQIPKRLAIVGAGAIGVEFAYFYNSFGSEVFLIEGLENIMPREDEEISDQLKRSFKKIGIKTYIDTRLQSAELKNNKVILSLETKKGIEQLDVDQVISAVGTSANIENIGLEELGIQIENGKIKVDEWYKTNVPNIYAIGDVIAGIDLAHVASAEGIVCVEKIAGHASSPIDYNNIPSCTYCIPEVASVGYTEKLAKQAGYEIKVGKFPFSASGKATANGDNTGFVKVIFDAKYGELLGCHIIGEGVTEMISEAVLARKLETTGLEIIKTIHPHPTLSEAFMEATAAAYEEVIHL